MIPAVLLLLSGALAGLWALHLRVTGNIHAVVPGVLYRSAQLEPTRLRETVAALGLRSVVNLRGARPGKPWYDAEAATLDELGVTHVDFDWSAGREVPPEEVARFIASVRTLPQPILVHCHGGADRSGLASALFLRFVEGAPAAAAEAQLSFRYGHVALPGTQAWPMDVTLARELAAPRPIGHLPIDGLASAEAGPDGR